MSTKSRSVAALTWGTVLLLPLVLVSLRHLRPPRPLPPVPSASPAPRIVTTPLARPDPSAGAGQRQQGTRSSGPDDAAAGAPARIKRSSGAPRRNVEADQLFAGSRAVHLEIDLPPEESEKLQGWHWRRSSTDRPEARATVREGDRTWTEVSVQLKGSAGSFQSIDEDPGLTLKFDTVHKDQRFHGLKKISLNNSVQDATFIAEKLCREIFLAGGVPVPRATHAVVLLNGRNLGIRVLVEGYNRQFLRQHFGDVSGNLFDSGFVQDINQDLSINSGDHPEDRSALDRLVEACAEPDLDRRMKRLEQALDVDRFLAFVALEVIVCHWDGYAMNRNNYRVFHDRQRDRVVFLPHGMDQVFGAGRGSTSQPIFPRMRGLVAQALLETSQGARLYVETLTRLQDRVLQVEAALARVDQLAVPVRAVLAETEPDQLPFYLRRIEDMKSAIHERALSLTEQLRGSTNPPPASGLVPVTGWYARGETGEPEMLEEKDRNGRSCLVLRAQSPGTVASWRSVQSLPPGRYRFECRVRCEEVGQQASLEPAGAALRVDGSPPLRRISGTRGWTKLTQPFRVGRGGPFEVELRLELRSDSGEVWFEKESLRVVQE